MTAEPELPGVDAYTTQLEDAHRASAWPGIQPPDQLAASSTTAVDPTTDLRELILQLLSADQTPAHHPRRRLR